MPTDQSRNSKARRALAAELARLRAVAELSLRQLGPWGVPAGTRPAIPHARIQRIESADAIPTAAQLQHWLDACQAGDRTRERVNALMEEVLADPSRWAAMLDDAPERHLQRLAAEREQAASRIDAFCHQWMPGLTQTAGYASALLAMLAADGYPIDVPVATDQRMRRQEILHDTDRTFRFLLTRRALTWCPAPDAVSMPGQVDRLRNIDSLPVAEVRVLEDDAGPVAGWSSFTLYDGEQAVVALEIEHRSLLALDDEDVARYRRRFEQMWAAGRPLLTVLGGR